MKGFTDFEIGVWLLAVGLQLITPEVRGWNVLRGQLFVAVKGGVNIYSVDGTFKKFISNKWYE